MLSRAVVLVVEDEPIIRMDAVDLIGTAGFDAIGSRNADEAIAILEARHDIRLVFTDIELPGPMDGLKLAHYVRERWPRLHLMVASGKIRDESWMPAKAKFFTKPYNDKMIVKELTRLLSQDNSK